MPEPAPARRAAQLIRLAASDATTPARLLYRLGAMYHDEPGRIAGPIRQLLRGMNAKALEDLAAAAAIRHRGEAGRARENALRRFLDPLLPDDFGIGTGFVVDAVGGVSAQQDLVIYRRGYHPVFEVNGIEHFVVEAVLAAIQVRARLTAASDIRHALDNLRSVKALDRSAGGRNHAVLGQRSSGPVDPDDYRHQVLTAVVTGRSPARSTLLGTWSEWLGSHPRRHWPNLYVDVRKGVGHYVTGEQKSATTKLEEAAHVTFSRALDQAPPLVLLASAVLSLARVVPIIDYSIEQYIKPFWWVPGPVVPVPAPPED